MKHTGRQAVGAGKVYAMNAERTRLDQELLKKVIMRDSIRVRELLKEGADVNARDKEHHETPLILAVKFSDAAMVHLLLDAGPEIDERDDWGRTALFYSPVHSEVFNALHHAGADVHARDKAGNTILMQKVSESASIADVEELLRLGIDESIKNEDGETALYMAERLGLVKIIDRLRVERA